MPLSKRTRIEVYLPIKNKDKYLRLRSAFENEFLSTFGGCTVIRNIKGLYKGKEGDTDEDDIDLIYADTPFDCESTFKELDKYSSELRRSILTATNEEDVLIVVNENYHSI